MAKTVIANTSCLISLHNIGLLYILQKLFGEVYITSDIQRVFGQSLPDWIKVQNPKNSELLTTFYAKLDKGEASAIALALEIQNATVIIDELKGRKFAESYNVKTVGTIGILIFAKEKGLVVNVMEEINKIIESGFRISKKLLTELNDEHREDKTKG
ncbi:putative nucleic acid-binding protein, contains PIN domain [Aequorivita sublithincola DSM 14238]|uniref:Putative nucleic acid-binding protein, contains PIN domain n=1 Tax=Aequorivita sublithincola (strain DSM 14238 / LMG 21431 / ACAM 643 / 9-3) TaxID=746697 RepID=I3YXD6_AEQSU|nr:DUF3368 domain-containing protein [Aequorivita sublithincola]AFL81654.1 putative nucleic acid-binding protein, contains PIN domain [Aequorivita sublithincola DSM 14238]